MTTRCEEWGIVWPCATSGVAQATLDAAEDMAVEILRSFGGAWLGVCEYHEDYWPVCSCGCALPYKDIGTGTWHNGGWMDCCRILLDHRPVMTVVSVTVLGTELAASQYALEGPWLRRLNECWPCQEECLDAPVSVCYTAGVPLPLSTPLVVGEVACEVLNALNGQNCRLPSRAIMITRQGVTVQMSAAQEFTKAGLLGLPLADAWLRMVNRRAMASQSKVYSPDLGRRRTSRV